MTNRPGRRRAAVVLLVLTTMLASLVAASAVDARTTTTRTRQTQDQKAQQTVEPLRFSCGVDIVNNERGVLCQWSASAGDKVRGYQLYRIVNGSPRELIATVVPGERLHAFDSDLAQGDGLVYGVVARNKAGRVIGLGGPVRLGIPG